ncbi:MAG TPA: HNH endonuclease [Dehalococcoidia bacterium]|nr:HNH endonuclease [Dehalococcoidia bacterium]
MGPSSPVLVLNQNYEPLNVCTVRRAFSLVDRGKAEIIENGRGYLHSPTYLFEIPSVIRLVYLIRRPRPQGRLTRRDVFLRDRFSCQYCGKQTRDLTLDHVLPRHRGGGHDWQNAVAACKHCNHRKAGRTPHEAHMVLIRQPFRPSYSFFRTFYPYLQGQDGWRKFIPGLDDADTGFA